MRIYPVFILILIIFAVAAPAFAGNEIMVMKPYAAGGSYGTGQGQIDNPLSVQTDADDNIYVLQQVHTNGARNKSVVTIYSKNLTLLRSFDVMKMSMADMGWDRAWSNFYYDDLASDFYIDDEGLIYILCGWDVVVMDKKGIYKYQFPVSSYMGWISGGIGNETQFYYPRGLVVTDDGHVVITSGSSPDKHEIIFINPDGKLSTKVETPISDIYDIARDRAGNLYVTGAGSNIVLVYNSSMAYERNISLNFSGYSGNPGYLAFFSNGNYSVSANGIYLYDRGGGIISHFMDNDRLKSDRNWGRPITTNSTDKLIVVSGMRDSEKTPQPIMIYKYESGGIHGAGERFDSPIILFGTAALVLLLVWAVGAWYIIRSRR